MRVGRERYNSFRFSKEKKNGCVSNFHASHMFHHSHYSWSSHFMSSKCSTCTATLTSGTVSLLRIQGLFVWKFTARFTWSIVTRVVGTAPWNVHPKKNFACNGLCQNLCPQMDSFTLDNVSYGETFHLLLNADKI